jgi:hypothetical protein
MGAAIDPGARFTLAESPKPEWLEWSPAVDLSAK